MTFTITSIITADYHYYYCCVSTTITTANGEAVTAAIMIITTAIHSVPTILTSYCTSKTWISITIQPPPRTAVPGLPWAAIRVSIMKEGWSKETRNQKRKKTCELLISKVPESLSKVSKRRGNRRPREADEESNRLATVGLIFVLLKTLLHVSPYLCTPHFSFFLFIFSFFFHF